MASIDELGGPAVAHSPITFVPSAGLRVIYRFSERADIPLRQALTKARMSHEVIETGNSVFPLAQLEMGLSYFPARISCTDFLFAAGYSESPTSDPYYRLLLMDEPTVLSSLRKAARLVHNFYNARISIVPDAGALWLMHSFVGVDGPTQTDAFVLGYLLRLIEALSGGPGNFRALATTDKALLARLSETVGPGVRIRHMRAATGVAIPYSILCLPPPSDLADASDIASLEEAISQLPRTIGAAVSLIVRQAMPDHRPTISLVAAAAGMSVRTLQRFLDAEHMTFKEIVARERFKLSRDWLLTTDMSVTEIARKLGYATPQSFTRAFSYWAGCSPSVYRGRFSPSVSLDAPISAIGQLRSKRQEQRVE